MLPPRHPLLAVAICAVILTLLVACGGGGGGSGGGGSTVPGSHLNVTMDSQNTANGTQISGLSAGDEISISIRNQGTEAFELSPATFAATADMDVRDFSLEFESNYVAPTGPQSDSDLAGLQPFKLLASDPVFGLSLRPDPNALQILADSKSEFLQLSQFALPESESVSLILKRVANPWAADAMLLVDGVHQADLLNQVQSDFSAWSGRVVGSPDSNVFLSFSSYGCQGWVQTPESIYHLIAEPTLQQSWSQPNARLIRERELIRSGYAQPGEHSCQTLLASQNMAEGDLGSGNTPHQSTRQNNNRHSASTAQNVLCRMALESDYDYLGVKFAGDQAAATTYATQLIAAVGHQFQSQVQTRLSLAYLALYTTSDDPWLTPDSGGDALQLLEEFRDTWLNHWPVNAEAAHLLCSGLNSGGVSYLNEVGDPRWAYSVSTFVQGNLNWSNFPFNPSPFNWDFIVVAHETGHLFNADHTHNYCPPFDECASSSAWGSCQDETDCAIKGTLLSYCHTCFGGTNKIRLNFEPYIANEMRVAAADRLDSWTISPGQTLSFTLIYDPLKSGDSSVSLGWEHNAANVASPFLVDLSGSD
ncbi:MAG: hypothetical protein H8E15_04445 [Planctomycetes bacterium]|nr:hypothetical protein [Planctomycetota bacterium]